MILGIDMGFWYGMVVTAVITLVLTLFAWLMPPKKKKDAVDRSQDA
jgi:hypothetical protein